MEKTLFEDIGNYFYNLATDKKKGFFAGVSKFVLFNLSLIYGLIVKILILFSRFNLRRFNCKLISVGNLTLGGTGKTTLVEFIAVYLKNQGHRVAILSRGYKRKIACLPAGRQACLAGRQGLPIADYETMGDEPYMLAKKLNDLPVIVDENRIRGISQALRDYRVDTLILDDGFQQWRIKKDLEIVTLDATRPFGNRHLIPRGILREPLSALRRADIVVITKTNLVISTQKIKDDLKRIHPSGLIFESVHHPLGFYRLGKDSELLGVEGWKGKSAVLFSGIGDADSFENLVRGLGINVLFSLRFGDHHNYTPEDLDKVISSCQSRGSQMAITTEKDAVKISRLGFGDADLQIFILRISLRIVENEEGFYNRLLGLYSF